MESIGCHPDIETDQQHRVENLMGINKNGMFNSMHIIMSTTLVLIYNVRTQSNQTREILQKSSSLLEMICQEKSPKNNNKKCSE